MLPSNPNYLIGSGTGSERGRNGGKCYLNSLTMLKKRFFGDIWGHFGRTKKRRIWRIIRILIHNLSFLVLSARPFPKYI